MEPRRKDLYVTLPKAMIKASGVVALIVGTKPSIINLNIAFKGLIFQGTTHGMK